MGSLGAIEAKINRFFKIHGQRRPPSTSYLYNLLCTWLHRLGVGLVSGGPRTELNLYFFGGSRDTVQCTWKIYRILYNIGILYGVHGKYIGY